jgi:retron-type reverse transcriptase
MNLDTAWRAFRQGKKPSKPIDAFAYHIEAELDMLQREIAQQTYRHGCYHARIVREKKQRQLAVASVRDRVVHRLAYDVLVTACDRMFDPDVWSCRQGKGLYGCLKRTQQLLGRHRAAYMWRMDITKFFDNVDHAVLRRCIGRHAPDPHVQWLCDEIIDSYHHHMREGQPAGIPIGNLTSQIFANIYLHEFDRYIRHVLKPLAYVRYGDDAVVWCRTRRQAEGARRYAQTYLAETLYLSVNPKSDVIVPARAGLHFLGHVVTDTYIVVDRHTTKAVLDMSTSRSVASYKSLLLAKIPKQQLDWQLTDELDSLLS